ncbi:MAG: hypothetical protein QOG64_2742 [Acidimicrobiaceae bacterium]|jgi:DNA-binding transcriptional ArsR family regulator|nr:hypothetical protein [Acidimicrobiaceae bacterium]
MPRREATPAEAKALSNPLRLRILRLCLDQALTNKQLADRLDKDPATVLHHVRTLVDTGFLAAEPVRAGATGALEKPYLATGKSWEISVGDDPESVLAPIDALRAEVLEAGDDAVVTMFRVGPRLSARHKKELVAKLHELAEEYAFLSDKGGEPLGLSVVLHRRRP